jgi:hypothetical protein
MRLILVMYDLYGVVLFRGHIGCYARGGSFERPASMGSVSSYNNMEVTNNVGPRNRYWFELIRRQARNVYLNMECGSDLKRRVWGSLVLSAGIIWIASPPAPLWWPLTETWWLPGGVVVGVTQLASTAVALALLGYSYRRFRGAPGTLTAVAPASSVEPRRRSHDE